MFLLSWVIFVELLKRFIQNIYYFSDIFVQHFTSIFIYKKGYGLSQHDVEVWT